MVVVPKTRCRIRTVFVAASIVLAAAACGSGAVPAPPSAGQTPGSAAAASDGQLVEKLSSEVGVAGAMAHLQALQKIADEHGGNRAAGTAGYDASVDYTAGVLRAAGFEVSTPTYQASGDDDVRPGTGRNVIAQTRTGDPDHVVMIGAHLDSVPAGPGIVDDGSGVASLLEIATRLGAARGAERGAVRVLRPRGERRPGLDRLRHEPVGRRPQEDHAVSERRHGGLPERRLLRPGRRRRGRGVRGAAGFGHRRAGAGRPAGKHRGRQPEIIEFVGDDESPFIEAGIPVGGAENGDRKKKTVEQARNWGGQAGERYDRCYHTACDRIDNVNRDVLDHYLRAIAGTLAHFATSTDELQR